MRIKYCLITSLLFSLFFCSCKKDVKKSIDISVTGKWQWVQSSGGIGGVQQFPEPQNNYILQINTDHSFRYTANGIVLRAGNYSVDFRVSLITAQTEHIIDFDDKSFGCIVQEEEGKLLLIDDVFDSFTAEYKKVN